MLRIAKGGWETDVFIIVFVILYAFEIISNLTKEDLFI